VGCTGEVAIARSSLGFPSWVVAAVCLALGGCQASASSPPEASPVAQAGAAPSCLAHTEPILAHVGRLGEGKLVALDPRASASVALDRGDFVYGSTWAPDGRSIAFRRRQGNVAGDTLAATELGLFSPDVVGEEVVLVVDSAPPLNGLTQRYPDGPSWSPDGQQLAFASQRESDHYRIWVLARSGGQARLLLPELDGVPHFYPRWSPRDPTRLAYIAESAGVADLWVVDLASRERQRLTSSEMEKLESPRWSPDGERLAFSALPLDRPAEQGERYDIYVLDLASAKRERITVNAGSNVDPAWSPDGSSLLVSSTRESDLTGPVQRLDLWRVWLDDNRLPEPLTPGIRGTSTTGTDWYPLAECGSAGGER
jgi:dipeptidyl aminopeptidase/acylaminoacyl peptidase